MRPVRSGVKLGSVLPDSARALLSRYVRRMAGGSILLGDVAARTATIESTCRVCPRRGSLRTDRLLGDLAGYPP
jgi:hypothetical protein